MTSPFSTLTSIASGHERSLSASSRISRCEFVVSAREQADQIVARQDPDDTAAPNDGDPIDFVGDHSPGREPVRTPCVITSSTLILPSSSGLPGRFPVSALP